MGNKRKCRLCGRHHGSGGCYRQRAERKKIRQDNPLLTKKQVAAMARERLLKKWGAKIIRNSPTI